MLNEITRWLLVVAGGGFAIASLLALYRVIVGPTILDRMVASDVLVTTLMLVVGTEMAINRHTNTIGLMVLLAATSVFATIMVARYVRRRSHTIPEAGGEPRV